MVSNGYEIQVSSYSISYKDSSTGNICSPVTNIPITSCVESGVCNHMFEVSSSFCHPSTNITVVVTTTNMFGSEEESDSRMIGITIPVPCMVYSSYTKMLIILQIHYINHAGYTCMHMQYLRISIHASSCLFREGNIYYRLYLEYYIANSPLYNGSPVYRAQPVNFILMSGLTYTQWSLLKTTQAFTLMTHFTLLIVNFWCNLFIFFSYRLKKHIL